MDFEIIAEGLAHPEGPVACDDGSVLVVEQAHGGRVSRVTVDRARRAHRDLFRPPAFDRDDR